jgi:hypothetical protein
VTVAQLESAVKANRPARPADGDRPHADGLADELAKALGVEAAKVETILQDNRPARPADGQRPPRGERPPAGPKGGWPGESGLVSALATGLNLPEATVKAAVDKLQADHEAEHATREADRYAAIAKALGVEASAVKAAFEAVRPAQP